MTDPRFDRLTVLVPAAGLGRRMGAEVSKQYLELDGRPILAHTLALFEADPQVAQILVIAPADEHDYCRTQIVERYGFAKVTQLVAGGAERQDSVRNGLRACALGADEIVLIHDGVRPLFDPALIEPLAAKAAEVGGCIVGVPVKDTVKQVADGLVRATPERELLWLAQTPQVFRFGLIRDAHEQALADGFSATDDASLLERLDQPVAMLEGDYRNLKITTPEDLVLARALLQWRREQR